MGYIKTNPVETIVRQLFSHKGKATFLEMVEAGFPLKDCLSYSDAEAKEKNDRDGRLYQYELALDVTLRNYLYDGLVYPAAWREMLTNFLENAHYYVVDDTSELELDGGVATDLQSPEAVRAAVAAVDEVNTLPNCYPKIFAGAIQRTLDNWTSVTPPWLDKGCACIAKNPDWQACHQELIVRTLPWQDAEDARPVMWKCGQSLFAAKFIGGVDL